MRGPVGSEVIITVVREGEIEPLEVSIILDTIKLTDYRVRDLDSSDGTSARVRVLTAHTDVEASWGSVGVHQNIIDASWTAVSDGLILGLIRAEQRND